MLHVDHALTVVSTRRREVGSEPRARQTARTMYWNRRGVHTQLPGRIAGVPVFKRGPLAIAFGEPLVVCPDEDPADFATRLEGTCYGLTRAAERALADGSRGAQTT